MTQSALGKSHRKGITLVEAVQIFSNEREVEEMFIEARWPNGIACPPPYSPELNPAERVFEAVRRWVEGRVYGSVEEKVDAVNEYLSRLESDPERVKSLVSWEWIRRNVQGLSEDYAASSS